MACALADARNFFDRRLVVTVTTSRHSLTFGVVDYWKPFDPYLDPVVRALLDCLDEGATVGHRAADAELVLFSVRGNEHTTASGTKVGFSGEPGHVPEHQAHWSIDSRYLARPNHLRFPHWAYQMTADSRTYEDPAATGDRFCNFMYSNPRCLMRNAFFEMLHAREPVEAIGTVYRNTEHPKLAPHQGKWFETKRAALGDYRFTIAFENEEIVGYTTEKLIDAWLANTVPIYWGNPAVAAEFPPDSYLSLYELGSMTKLVEAVLEAHHEPERYAQLAAANPFRTGRAQQVLADHRRSLQRFAGLVVDDAASHAKRRRASREVQLRAQARQLRIRASKAIRS